MTLFLYFHVSMAEENPLWLRYPAISPDGSTIAFSYKGDIYTVNVDGGQALQLTTNPAYDYKPVWSPDGSKIAFASDRNGNFDVFVISAAGGEPTRLSYYSGAEIPACFSPDGKMIYFASAIGYDADYSQFPQSSMTQLYSVPVAGGRSKQIFTVAANDAVVNKSGDKILYHDYKGYEDNWRKHHTSSVTRDVWEYDMKTGKCTQLSRFQGENRNPVFSPDETAVYYLSEQSGDFNIWKMALNSAEMEKQITNYVKHPVRFLTIAGDGTMCYNWNGEIYTIKEDAQPRKVNVTIKTDQVEPKEILMSMTSGARGVAISPSGKEIALIIRGDVFVTSVDYQTTKRITNTPFQERSVSFSPDGRSLVYASERDGLWNIYTTSIVKSDEKQFVYASELKEEQITKSKNKACFQPAYSPDGKSIAYLEDRTTLRVINPKTGKSVTVLDGKYNYSYGDGDQYYQWAPDSKWLIVRYFENGGWKNTDIGLVKADGSQGPINLTQSAYADDDPQWVLGGKAIAWTSDRNGYRSHGSWGSNSDIFIMFTDPQAWQEWQRTKEEQEIFGIKDAKKDTTQHDLQIVTENIKDRVATLTWSPSSVGDFYLMPDGSKLFYTAGSQDGYDLWVKDMKDQSTKIFLKGKGGSILPMKDGKTIFVVSGGQITKVETGSGKTTPVTYQADFLLRPAGERQYITDHIWKQMLDKLYAPDMNGVDWAFYKKAYERFLPDINNNYDFKDVLGEMLGELNVSHTGARYAAQESGDRTAWLGAFYDNAYNGGGLKIREVINKGPLDLPDNKIKAGTIIEKIDGEEILAGQDWFHLLNRKAGKRVRLSLYNPQSGEKWEETVKPIQSENSLLYDRWIEQRRAMVDKLSGGKIGYVHVKGMDSQSFRQVFSQTLGLNRNKEAIVIDSRFNGGGWLHEDLVTLFSGKKYMDISPRGQHVAIEPFNKWSKPSVLLVGEGNYSDAHAFPYSYKTLELGKLVGMPVPGTMTLVWWENQQDPSIVFGIPQMGIYGNNGKYLEGQQLEPDIRVANDPNSLMQGRDLQLERAVEELMKDVK